jgi:hypothetical protein
MGELDPLLQKLQKAKFTGSLDLRFEAGEIASARLTHFLPFSELSRQLPGVGSHWNQTISFDTKVRKVQH